MIRVGSSSSLQSCQHLSRLKYLRPSPWMSRHLHFVAQRIQALHSLILIEVPRLPSLIYWLRIWGRVMQAPAVLQSRTIHTARINNLPICLQKGTTLHRRRLLRLKPFSSPNTVQQRTLWLMLLRLTSWEARLRRWTSKEIKSKCKPRKLA